VSDLRLHYLTRFGVKSMRSTESPSPCNKEKCSASPENPAAANQLLSMDAWTFYTALKLTSGDVRVLGESLMNRTPRHTENVLAKKVSTIRRGVQFSEPNPKNKGFRRGYDRQP